MARLVVLQGPDKGRTLTTTDDRAVLGRTSDLRLMDQTVSRRHAELRRDGQHWVLDDMNSANGTYLNHARLQKPTRLKSGDQIRIGNTLLVYSGDESEQILGGPQIPADLVTLDAGAALDASVLASIPSSEDSVVMAAPDTAYAVRSWKALNELAEITGQVLTVEELLPRVLDVVFGQIQAERAVIFMVDEETDELLPEVVRVRGADSAGAGQIAASRTILNHVRASREGVLCSNLNNDERFQGGESVQNLGMRSVICAPIVAREQVLGVIHLDTPVQAHTYNEHELRLTTTIGYQTGLAIENTRLLQAVVERERLAAAGETVAYLSHSVKNILQGMRSGGAVVQRGLDKQDFTMAGKGWSILDRNLDKCYRLMMNMLAFSKRRKPYLVPVQVNKLVDDVVDLMQKVAEESNTVLLADVDGSLPEVPCDYDGLHQVLLNLVTNALDALADREGLVNVRTGRTDDGRYVLVSVADNGPGIPADMRATIFEPFQSTKGHAGTGLGLPVARKIVEELGGKLTLNNPPDGGAEFTIYLPTRSKDDRGSDDSSINTLLEPE